MFAVRPVCYAAIRTVNIDIEGGAELIDVIADIKIIVIFILGQIRCIKKARNPARMRT